MPRRSVFLARVKTVQNPEFDEITVAWGSVKTSWTVKAPTDRADPLPVGSPQATSHPATYHGSSVQNLVTAGFFSFSSVLFVAQAFSPGKGGIGLTIFAGISSAVCLVLVARGLRCATLIASSSGLTARTLLRTRDWSWKEIQSFGTEVRPVGAAGWERSVLCVCFADGSTRWLTEMNVKPNRSGSPTRMDLASVELNKLANGYNNGSS